MKTLRSFLFVVVAWAFLGVFVQTRAQAVTHYINVDEYNAEQKRRAKELARDLVQQQRESSCQTNAAFGLAYLTGVIASPHKAYIEPQKKDMSPDEFHDLLVEQGLKPTHQTMEIANAFNPGATIRQFGNTSSMEEKINAIADAIDEGHPVLVSLMALPIWEGIYRNSGLKYDMTFKEWITKAGHAVIVIGVKRDNEGDVLGFYLRDTGLGKSYYSDAADFTQGISPSTSVLRAMFNAGTDVFVPGRRGIERTGKVLTPVKFLPFTGEWENKLDGSRLNGWYAPGHTRLNFSYSNPPQYRAKDELHGWIEKNGNDNRYVRKAFKFHGCSISQEVYPVLAEKHFFDNEPALTIKIRKVPAGRIFPTRKCSVKISGLQEVIYEKIGSKTSGWKPDPEFVH